MFSSNRCATNSEASLVSSSISIANSSPPSRAVVSARARSAREAPCDDPDHLVARLMPQRVVDRLEVVEVEEEDGER